MPDGQGHRRSTGNEVKESYGNIVVNNRYSLFLWKCLLYQKLLTGEYSFNPYIFPFGAKDLSGSPLLRMLSNA